jgi:rhodanese-related sulfurtransferase
MKNSLLIIFSIVNLFSFSQETIADVLKKYNKESIPYITANELATPRVESVLLDAREIEEYKVSHLKNAIHVGYDNFSLIETKKILSDNDAMIVVYCSIGVRSEDIAEKLKKEGHKNVYNLFGGIFEWKNNNFTVYNSKEEATENVHAFSKDWSKWLLKGKKVYD